jgi:hypothetical protein
MPKTTRHQTVLLLEHPVPLNTLIVTKCVLAFRNAEKGVDVDAGDGVDEEDKLS